MTLGAKAQGDLGNTGIVYISSATDTLYIGGTLTNASGSALTNNGQLYVRQHISNAQSGMAVGTGMLLLTGTTSQSIGGAQPFKTFNLTTNNSAGIVLNSNLDISGTHTFVNGVITSSATPNYLIYEAGASYTGDGNTAHVNGWVKKFGNTAFAFPLGNGTVERRVNLTNLSASSEFNAHYYASTPNTGSVQSPIVQVDPYEYWTINQVSGGTAQVLMNWDKSKVNFPMYVLADVRAVYNNAGTWVSIGGTAAGNVSTTGTITSNAVASFGNFTFGSVSVSLPLEFLGIWALADQTYNVVQWKTARESAIDHFDIQRSSDGATYTNIGSTLPVNGTGGQSYQFTDRIPLPGTNWYRVQSVDANGAVKFSPVASVSPGNRGNAFYVINNPVTSTIYLAASEKYKGAYEYQLVSTSGQVVQQGNIIIGQSGIFSVPVDSRIIKGTYVFRIYNSAYQLVDKIIVQ